MTDTERKNYYVQPIMRAWTEQVETEVIHEDSSLGVGFYFDHPVSSGERRKAWRYHEPKKSTYLTFDTETTTDTYQRLLYGAFYLCECDSEGEVIEGSEVKGFFYEPGLPEYEVLVIRDYCYEHGYVFMSLSEFCWDYLLKRCFYKAACYILGYNLPFDISRIALKAAASSDDPERFTFSMFDSYEGKILDYYPRIQVKKIGSHKSFINWTTGFNPKKGEPTRPMGKFIDISQAVNAYSGLAMPMTLKAACKRYHTEHQKIDIELTRPVTPEQLEYCLNDVMCTWDLHQAVKQQHKEARTFVGLHKVYSSASLSKALLKSMQLTPPLEINPSFPPQIMGYCTAAFYGGRAEVRYRDLLPGVMLDFTSMYPTVGALMKLTEYITAQKVTAVQQDVRELNKFLETILSEGWVSKDKWPDLTGIALVKPTGDILPVRARFGDTHNISVTNFTYDREVPYFLPDLVASTLLTGRIPEIRTAWKFVPRGRQGIQRTTLPGGITLDLRRDDLFAALVEARQAYKLAHCQGHPSENDCIELNACQHCANSLMLKILANGLYGIFAELNRANLSKPVKLRCWGASGQPWIAMTKTPETPGNWCFPPLAGLFVSGARLMLALLEHEVTSSNGIHATTDTDSMFIGATPDGRTLDDGTKTLTVDEVEVIAGKFDELSPYRGDIRMLKRDYPKEPGTYGYCLPVSTKRYALLDIDGKTLKKKSKSGLGHLMVPEDDWMSTVWNHVIAERLALDEVVLDEQDWLDCAITRRLTLGTPALYKLFSEYNSKRSYQDSIKPFNFIMTALLRRSLMGNEPRLIAPYNKDVHAALDTEWIDVDTHGKFQLVVDNGIGESFTGAKGRKYSPSGLPVNFAVAKTYRDYIYEYAYHPETKAAQDSGLPASIETTGLLGRLNIIGTGGIRHIGKESNYPDEGNAGLRNREPEYLNNYSSDDSDYRNAITILSCIPTREIRERWADRRGKAPSEREIRRIINGEVTPHKKNRLNLIKTAHMYTTQPKELGDPTARLEWFSKNEIIRACPNCGRRLGSRQKTCSARCRMAEQRKRNKETGNAAA